MMTLQKQITQLKMAMGCEVCGYNEFPCALEWNHIDPLAKVSSISSLLRSKQTPEELVWEEISKCEVLCSTCHKVTSYLEPSKGKRGPSRLTLQRRLEEAEAIILEWNLS